MKHPIIAVIDIGSNSIRLQISKVLDKTYKVIEEHKETVRIGDNVYRTGSFSADAIETIVSIISGMKTMIENNKVEHLRVTATAPFREASNGEEVVDIVEKATGVKIEIITGIEEARLMCLAASAYFQMTEGNTLLIDMGGGSTEFSYLTYGDLDFSISTDLGCSKLTYQYFKNDPVKLDEIKMLKSHIKEKTLDFLPLYGVDKLICSGGTLGNLSLIYNKRNNLSDSAVKFVDSVFLKHFISEISGKSVAERLKIPALEPARADIMLSASILVQMLVKRYRLEGFFTLSAGLRTGLTIDLMNKIGYELLFQGDNGAANLRYSRLIETGKKYMFEEKHAMQVARLSEKIFESLRELLGLELDDWELLEAAAILHDVGQYISYSKHHKHSYYLIMNTELAGYSEQDIPLIANIARYHRRSLPKNDHANIMHLDPKDRQRVAKLSAILRVADALDRSHSSFVKDIEVAITDKILFTLSSDDDISMETAGFDKKKDLLASLSGKAVEIA